jgi:hypothetical protein
MKPGPDGRYPDEAERWDRAVAGGQAAITRYLAGYLRRVRAVEDRRRYAEGDEHAELLRDRNAARMRRTRHPEQAATEDAVILAAQEAERVRARAEAERYRQRVIRENRAGGNV